IALHHHRHHELRGFEGREALAALQALATTADLAPFTGEARVVHLGLDVAAERTVHAVYPALLPVHRETAAELEHLSAHAFDDRRRSFGIQHLGDEIRNQLHLRLLEAAGGRGRGADAQAAGYHRRP